MKVSFYLHNRENADGSRPVFMLFTFDAQRLRKFAGSSVYVSQWNKREKRVKDNAVNAGQINTDLEALREKTLAAYKELLEKGEPTLAQLRAAIDAAPAPAAPDPVNDTLALAWTRYEAKVRGMLSDSYLRNFEVSAGLVEVYTPGVRLGQITPAWLNGFIKQCQDRGNASGTIVNYLKLFHHVLKDNGLATDWIPRIKEVNAERVFLSWEELLQLYHADRQELGKFRARVLDVFLFACFTGLRYSDFSRVTPATVHDGAGGVKVYRFTAVKGRKTNEVPLSPYAAEILERYQGQLPVFDRSYITAKIKKIAETVGLTRQVTVVKYSGAKRMEKSGPLWGFVSCHTARHTFATISLQKGMPVAILSKLLGHNSLDTTMVYAKIMDAQKVEAVLDAWKME